MVDENLERITILLQAKDRDFQRAMDRNNKVIAKLAKDAVKNTSQMSRDIDSRLGALQSSVSSFGVNFVKGMGIGLVTTALAGLSTNIAATIKGVAAIGDEAKRSGLSVEAFQEWKYVAEQNRIGVDQLVDGFKELSLRADEFAVTGGGSAAESFKRLGFSGAELTEKLKDPSALMLELIGRMGSLDKAAQIRVSDEIFGGSAGERFVELINQGEAGLRKTIAAGYDAGAVMDAEMIAKAAELDQRFATLQTTISNAFKTGVVEAADFFFGATTGADILIAKFGDLERAKAMLGEANADALLASPDAATDSADQIDNLIFQYEDLRAAISSTQSAISGDIGYLFEIGADEAAMSLSDLSDQMQQLLIDFDNNKITAEEFRAGLEAVTAEAGGVVSEVQAINGIDLSSAVSVIGALTTAMGFAFGAANRLRAAMPGQTVALDDDRSAAIADKRQGADYTSPLAPTSSMRPKPAPSGIGGIDWGLPSDSGKGGGGAGKRGGASRANGYEQAVTSARESIAQWEAEAVALTAVIKSGGQYANVLDYARKRAELLNEAQKAGREITPELAAEIDALAESYAAAGDQAKMAADRLQEMEESSKRGADAMSDIFTGVLSGAKSAREAVADLLMQIAQVQMRKAILGMAEAGGGGGFFGMLGGLLGGARAGGGPTRAGVPYLVNENTPNSEVFVPSRSGGVLNVAQAKSALSDGMGGGGGQTMILLELSPDIEARILQKSGAQTVQMVRAADRSLPDRMKQINNNPRVRR